MNDEKGDVLYRRELSSFEIAAWPHPPRGTCVPGCAVNGRCHCGCGMPTHVSQESHANRGIARGLPFVWVRGHNHRSDTPNVRYVYSLPIQRVLPLVEFLFHEHGSNLGTAKAIGVSEWAVRRWRGGQVQRVSPSCTRRVVEAVKAHEESLRDEAHRDERRASNAQREMYRARARERVS